MKTGIAQQTHVKTASLSKNLNTRPTEIAVRIIVLPTIQLDPPLRFDQLGTFAIPATNLEKINPANAKAREIAREAGRKAAWITGWEQGWKKGWKEKTSE